MAPWRASALVALAAAARGADSFPGDNSLSETFSEGLKQQALRELRENGESITIMACGESGLGKTSLLSSLFHTELVWPAAPKGKATRRVAEQSVVFDLEGMPFSARLIDTPGYDGAELHKEFGVVTGRLEAGFRRILTEERRIKRSATKENRRKAQLDCVDVALYFFAPHRCKKADIAFLRKLQGRVSIVPILAKADSMTAEELADFRSEVSRALKDANVPVAHPPLAIITAARPAGGSPLGREYPWGLAESETGSVSYVHSEVEKLRRFLLIDGLLDLKQRSQQHYETYRARVLSSQERGLRGVLRSLLSPVQLLSASLLLPRPRRFLKRRLLGARALLPAGFRLRSPTSLIRRKASATLPSDEGGEGGRASPLRRRLTPRQTPPPPPEEGGSPRRRGGGRTAVQRVADYVWHG